MLATRKFNSLCSIVSSKTISAWMDLIILSNLSSFSVLLSFSSISFLIKNLNLLLSIGMHSIWLLIFIVTYSLFSWSKNIETYLCLISCKYSISSLSIRSFSSTLDPFLTMNLFASFHCLSNSLSSRGGSKWFRLYCQAKSFIFSSG